MFLTGSTRILFPQFMSGLLNRVWSIGLYVDGDEFSPETELTGPPAFCLNSKKLRKESGHIHTYADPFLIVDREYLYVFYETQRVGMTGSIEAVRTSDLRTFEMLGEIFAPGFHVSYPFVVRSGREVYLIPESSAANEVALYRFAKFPYELKKVRVLLEGAYWDSSVHLVDGYWFLFTTSNKGLEIHFTNDLTSGDLTPHSQNPVTTDPKFFRCGGGIIAADGRLYRVAQDSSGEYGRNIHIMAVTALSQERYIEELYVENYFKGTETWNRLGGHHLTVEKFHGNTILATDGLQNDMFVNKLMALFFR
jgi:hypothetical protein